MNLRTTERIEASIDGAAALLFAAAAGFAVLRALDSLSPALASAGVAFLGMFLLLRAVRPSEPIFAIAGFELQPTPARGPDELLLEDGDRLAAPAADELMLDDVLAEPEPDSRVVRLFDPS